MSNVNLNSIQTIYTIFFALYYGATIARINNLNLFDTTALSPKYPKTVMRFIISFFFINVIPLFYFWKVMIWLDSIEKQKIYLDFSFLLIVFIQSIVGFGLYRILVGIIIIPDKAGEFYFYDPSLYTNENHPIKTFLSSRPDIQKNPMAHYISGIIWVGITVLLLYLYIISPKLIYLIYGLLVFSFLVAIPNKEGKKMTIN